MTVLTIHTQAGQPFFDEARNALNDLESLRVYVTVGDKQTVFTPHNIELQKPVQHSYDNPFGAARTIPTKAIVELWPA